MPTVAAPPAARTHSWDLAYFKSAGTFELIKFYWALLSPQRPKDAKQICGIFQQAISRSTRRPLAPILNTSINLRSKTAPPTLRSLRSPPLPRRGRLLGPLRPFRPCMQVQLQVQL